MWAIPCPDASQGVSTCGAWSSAPSTRRLCPSAGLVMPPVVLTRGALRVKCFKWECGTRRTVKTAAPHSCQLAATAKGVTNVGWVDQDGRRSCVQAVVKYSRPRATTVSDAPSANRSMSEHATEDTHEATRKTRTVTANEEHRTHGGKMDRQLVTIADWRSATMAHCAYGADDPPRSSIIGTRIVQTTPYLTSNLCAGSATGRNIKSAASACAPVPSAKLSLSRKGRQLSIALANAGRRLDATGTGSERRYSQYHWKQWINTLLYGKGPVKLANELELEAKVLTDAKASGKKITKKNAFFGSIRLAKELTRKFFDGIPKAEEFILKTHERAAETKYVETIAGRRRWLRSILDVEEQDSHQYDAHMKGNNACHCSACRDCREGLRQAVNTIIQGSAADVVQEAMIRLHEDEDLIGCNMLFQVHDEVNFEVPDEILIDACKKIKWDMENCGITGINVPLLVEPGYGNSWVDAH